MLRWRGQSRELSGFEPATTNNRMELEAAISALEALKRPMAVRMFTDSDYLRQGITAWLPRWKARGWRTADQQPVKNQDLWQRLEQALARHRVGLALGQGHSGNPDNERADELARTALRAGRSGEETGRALEGAEWRSRCSLGWAGASSTISALTKRRQ